MKVGGRATLDITRYHPPPPFFPLHHCPRTLTDIGTVTMVTVPGKNPCFSAKKGSRSKTLSPIYAPGFISLTLVMTAMLTSSLAVSPDTSPPTRTSSCKLSLDNYLSITYGN